MVQIRPPLPTLNPIRDRAEPGAEPKQFADAMHSFAVDAKLTHAKQFVVQSGVQGTPTIVVDGKYRVIGKSYDDMLRITNQLIARERSAGAAHP